MPEQAGALCGTGCGHPLEDQAWSAAEADLTKGHNNCMACWALDPSTDLEESA